MSDSNTFCIPSNPDISGVGVRSAIYAQNILSFIPALVALWDTDVSPTELASLETQSTTILVTALALLIAAFVLGEHPPTGSPTQGLSNFHIAIILNLSWMNNTNTFIYFLLHIYHEIEERRKEIADLSRDKLKPLANEVWQVFRTGFWTCKMIRKLFLNKVMIIGSLHLSMMSGAGIWLWRNPGNFPNLEPCSMEASLFVVGRMILFGSRGLRILLLMMYSLFALPMLNLIPPTFLFLILYFVLGQIGPKYKSTPSERSFRDLWHVMVSLVMLGLWKPRLASLGTPSQTII